MRHFLAPLLALILAGCQAMTATTAVIGNSIACSSSENQQSFPKKGARQIIDLSFQIKDSGQLIDFTDRAVCEYQGSMCGGGRWFEIWYGEDRNRTRSIRFSNGEELSFYPHGWCVALDKFHEKCAAGDCDPIKHFELRLLFSEERKRKIASVRAGHEDTKSAESVEEWVKKAIPDRDLVTAEEISGYGYVIKFFNITVTDAGL